MDSGLRDLIRCFADQLAYQGRSDWVGYGSLCGELGSVLPVDGEGKMGSRLHPVLRQHDVRVVANGMLVLLTIGHAVH